MNYSDEDDYEEGCEYIRPRWSLGVMIACAVIVAVILFGIGHKLHAAPFYCKPLTKFERSCKGVKAAALMLGRERATALARKCGATDEDMREAAECFKSGGSYDAQLR